MEDDHRKKGTEMSTVDSSQELTDAIKSLSDSPTELANKLSEAGINGIAEMSTHCPMSVWLMLYDPMGDDDDWDDWEE